jgi:membrane protease subunit HflC
VTEGVLAEVAGPARNELGVEVVDVRVRRFNHPLEVRPAVFDLIRSERRHVAATLRAEGEARFQTLTSQADRERDERLARADSDAERIRGQGDAEAARVLNEAHARDPRFFEFLRTLEAYRAMLDGKATVVLSADSPLLRLFTQGPSAELLKETRPAPSPGESPGTPLSRTPVAGSQEGPP